MKLQILIPQYKETEEIIKPLLDSIAIQQNVDFREIGAIIVNDGTDVHLSEDFLKGYPFEIKYHLAEHGGVSAARDKAFEFATAEYVMWCDADDMFFNACGLWIVFHEMQGEGFDALTSVFVEETRHPETKETVYINREMDSTFVHGKIYKRQYLIDQNIRWNHALTIHEDSFFNIQCLNLTPNVKYCMSPFYLWRWRDDSVCRHDPKYILKTYRNMIDSNDALIEEFKKRRVLDKARSFVAFLVYDAYYLMNKPEWINQENKEYRDATELRFKEYFLKHEKDWNDVPVQEKMQISQGIRGRTVMEGMQMEKMTIDQWLDHIKEM